MTNPGELQQVVEDNVASASVTEDIEVVGGPSAAGRRGKVRGLSKFPLLVGVLVVAFDIYLFARFPKTFLSLSMPSAVTLALFLASVILGLLLITHAFGLGYGDHSGRSSYLTGFLVPLVVGALAMMTTITGLDMSRAANERQPWKSCIDVIEQAANIAKDNPRFRMSTNDRDEIRCGINAVLGR